MLFLPFRAIGTNVWTLINAELLKKIFSSLQIAANIGLTLQAAYSCSQGATVRYERSKSNGLVFNVGASRRKHGLSRSLHFLNSNSQRRDFLEPVLGYVVAEIQTVLRHESATTTAKYIKSLEREGVRSALEALSQQKGKVLPFRLRNTAGI